ncbi:dihydrofolate reductase, partial [Patescibacteria group bacterium]|nr:dihydrofolate reductase [Patescibacteria group bacterium]
MISWLKQWFSKKPKKVTMIAAIQKDRGIGYQGKLIHNIKNDMAHFVKQTEGHVVIMGR